MTESKPLIHVACAVIHRESDDSFFMGQRAKGKHHEGYWEFIGGKKEPNETIQQTMEREVKEEVGAKGKAGEVVTQIDHDYLNGPHVLLYFVKFNFDVGAEINPNPDDYQKVDWIKRQKLLDLNLSEGDRLFAQTLMQPKT